MDPNNIEQAHAAVAAFANQKPLMRVPSMFFTSEHKQALYALIGFCRIADDLVDEEQASVDKFNAWRQQVRLPVDQQTDPFLIAWADVRTRYAVDPAYEEAFLDGLALDLACHRYETLDELKNYIYCVTAIPFTLAISIVGFRQGITLEEAKPLIENIAFAMHFSNIIRDLSEDLSIGRIYLPKSELAAFGLTFADIEAKRCDDRFKNFLRHFINVAQGYYTAGWPILDLWSGSSRLAGGLGFVIYRTFLNEVEAHNFDVFTHRLRFPAWKMLWLLTIKWPAIYWTKSADKYFLPTVQRLSRV